MAVLSWAAAAAVATCYASLVTAVVSQLASPAAAAAEGGSRDGATRSRVPTILEHPSSVHAIGGRPVTLRCRHWSEKGSQTEVSWYKDSERVATHLDNPNSYFHLDRSTGDLLILQFIQQYSGTYYCNVTNLYGSAVSTSAIVSLAYISDEFESSPQGIIAASGQDVRFTCTPPLALPPPKTTWKTDSASRDPRTLPEAGPAGRVLISADTNGRLTLTLVNVSKADAGEYWCTAENEAGRRTSYKAVLSVEEKPLFILSPEDTTVKVDGSVTLHCVARSGDTLVPITWIKDGSGGGSEPVNGTGRWRFLNDGNLSIQPVHADDEGRYTCLAHGNITSSPGATGEAGAQMSAYLTVDTSPYVLGKPVDRVASERGTAYFHCHAESSPPPRIIWQRASSTDIVFSRSGHANGRLLVFDNGTLRISDVRQQDSGEYNCFVINRAGSSSAKANLSIQTGAGADPPPSITSPPRNVAAELGSTAFFTCSVDGRRPVVRWLKDGRPLLAGGRFTIDGAANLRIADVQVGDSGSYTCLAMSKSGDASATAQLSATGLLHATGQHGQLPMPPGKPRAVVFADAAVLLSVPSQQQQQHGADWEYRAEGFSYSVPEGWVVTPWVLSDGKNIVFRAVVPRVAYYFVVRIRSSHGYISEPSLPSDVVQIPGSPGAASSGSVSRQMQDGKDAASRMPAVALVGMPYATGSTSVNVTWVIVANNSITRLRTRQTAAVTSPFVEGFYVRTYSRRGSERRTDVVFSSLSTYHVINNLEPYTMYRVSVAPFYAGEIGLSTKPVDVMTGEDVPTGPPLDIRAVYVSAAGASAGNSSASRIQVTWQPPEKRHHRGTILGYTVLFTDATGQRSSWRNVTVDGASTTTAELNVLQSNVNYRVKVAAFTRVGLGMSSRPMLVDKTPTADVGQSPVGEGGREVKRPVTDEPWFLPTVIGFIGLSTCATILFLVVCLCLRHRSGRPLCSKKGRFLPVPYEGALGDSTAPDAYLAFRLEAMDRTAHHEQSMLTNERMTGGGGSCDGELEFDDDFRCQTPVPPYPPVPPPIAAPASSSRGKLVEEHNLDSSGDSTPAGSCVAAAADAQHRRGGGGRKGALYSKASVLESLGETAVSTAGCGGGSAGLYATTCLYRLSQDSLLNAQPLPRDSRQVATGQAPPPSSSSSSTAPPTRAAERFNVRGGSESSCTDNNGRSSAGTGSEAALPHGGAAAAADDCSCCTGECYSLRRGQSPQLPQFVDMLPPPPQYPYYPVSPLATESRESGNTSGASSWQLTAAELLPSTAGQAGLTPTSVATLLRHVHPPPPPLLHQHSAPQMGHARVFQGRGGGSISCSHQHPSESAYAAGNTAVSYCPYCFNDRRRTSGALGMTAAVAEAAVVGWQYPHPKNSRSDLARACQGGGGGGKSDDSATLHSRHSTDSDLVPAAVGDTMPSTPHCHYHACSCSRSFGRSHYHSGAYFDPCSKAAAVAGQRHTAGGSDDLAPLRTRFCPHSAAATPVRCRDCLAPSSAALLPSGLHGTVSYPSGFMMPAAAAASAAPGCHGLVLAEEASSAAEYEEPWEDQPWLYNPSAWSGVVPRTGRPGGVAEQLGQASSGSIGRPFHPGAAAAAAFSAAAPSTSAGAASRASSATAAARASDGPGQLTCMGPHSDQDDEVAAAMACIKPLAGDKVAIEDSLDSSSLSDAEGESRLFTNEAFAVHPDHRQQSKAAKVDGSLLSKRQASSKPPAARHGRRRTAVHGSAAGNGGGYSTDSSFVFVPLPRRPYPKSARRRQMQQQQHHHYRRHARPSTARLQSSKLAAGADDNDDEEEEEDATDRV